MAYGFRRPALRPPGADPSAAKRGRSAWRRPAAGTALLLALALGGCGGGETAPVNAGVCWRIGAGRGDAAYRPILRGVKNPESCAAALEQAAMREGSAEVDGAFQGQFLFVTPDMIQSSMTRGGARYRMFDANTRRKLDQAIRWRLDDARHPSRFAPPGARGGGAGAP